MRRFAPFVGESYEPGVVLGAKPVEVYAIFGGQWPHSSFMIPGGVMCAPTLTDITRSIAILDYFRQEWIEKQLLGCSIERYLEIKTWEELLGVVRRERVPAQLRSGLLHPLRHAGSAWTGTAAATATTWRWAPSSSRASTRPPRSRAATTP